MATRPAPDPRVELSPVRGDALFRAQCALGLIPAHGLGVVRGAILAALVTWAPLAIAAAVANRLGPGAAAEPLLQHFGVHVRFLVAVPLLIIGEALADAVARWLLPHFIRSGLVAAADRPRFVALVQRIAALRDGWRSWAVIAGLVVVWTVASPAAWEAHELRWAVHDLSPSPALDFGVFWYRYVARPVFVMLLLVWLWRLVLATVLMWQVSRLDLVLVATHPDRAGGLGVVEALPLAFAPAAFAIAAVLAGRWTHDALYHGVPLNAFMVPLGVFAGGTALLLLVPLLVFVGPLGAARRRALLDYGALVGEHHRLVRRRWLLGETLRDDAMLNAPELGPVADTVSLYDAVARMRPVPAGKWTLIAIAVLILLPMLPLVAVEVGLKEALLKVVQTLL